ncbi:response regulator [Acidobacteriia bacterium AH_259_A11_L15]|nr:response regulator [Acidobacteriia bacterium AH_259_A11_L15]
MKVLLAEDEEDIRRLAVMGLKRGSDWQILEAADGEECLQLAHQEHPDLVLLDAMMPKLDGFQVCQRLKTTAATRDIPVIFLTASVQEWETQRGLALGAIGYLYKPFDPMQLRQQVLDLLAQAGRVPSSSG